MQMLERTSETSFLAEGETETQRGEVTCLRSLADQGQNEE